MRYVTLCILALLGLSAFIIYRGILRDASVTRSTGTTFAVPQGCKRLALLGCTPHPTEYLSHKKDPKTMANLTLKDFLDRDDLKDSFTQVLKICEDNKVDHLLIAYLPIYFVSMRKLLQERFVDECEIFLHTIAPQIADVIKTLKKELGISVPVTLVIPSREALEKTPRAIGSSEDRVRYSIKQFPHLDGIDHLEDILIINNKGSSQNDGIIRYLRYEYLLEPPVSYTTRETSKKRFHAYINHKDKYESA